MRKLALALVCLTCAVTAPSPASAHSWRPPGDTSGTDIPNITHGEMTVITRYQREILRLAESVPQPDDGFRTLLRYAGLQYSNCFWGLMPGSISDEESPFNECSHAYLAASKELLMRMRTIEPVAAEAQTLVSKIDAEVTLTGAALIGCVYSGENFNTAEVIRPDWPGIFTHLPSLASTIAAIGILPMAAFVLSQVRRRREPVKA